MLKSRAFMAKELRQISESEEDTIYVIYVFDDVNHKVTERLYRKQEDVDPFEVKETAFEDGEKARGAYYEAHGRTKDMYWGHIFIGWVDPDDLSLLEEDDIEEYEDETGGCSICRGGGGPCCDKTGFFTGFRIY